MLISLLDILCFLIASFSILMGFASGAVRLGIDLVFFIISILFAMVIFTPIEEALTEHLTNKMVIDVVGGFVSYLISLVFCTYMSKHLKKLTEVLAGGFADRIVGGILGGIRAAVLSLGVFSGILILTGGSYPHANNMLELVEQKEKAKYPKWVRNAMCYDAMSVMLDGSLKIVGKKTLQEMKVPHMKHEKDDEEKKDEGDT